MMSKKVRYQLAATYNQNPDTVTYSEIRMLQRERSFAMLETVIRVGIFLWAMSMILVMLLGTFPRAYAAEIVPLSWNADEIIGSENGEGQRVFSGWKNFYDGFRWTPIELQAVDMGDGSIVMNGAPYTIRTPSILGEAPIRFENDSLYDKDKERFNTAAELVKEKEFLDAAPVAAKVLKNAILYENAFPKYDADLMIRFQPNGVQYLIVLNQQVPSSMSGKDVRICFSDTISGDTSRKINTLQRIAYDSGKSRKTISVKYEDGCKIIPWEFLEKAEFPVYADDVDIIDSSTGVDGEIVRDGCGFCGGNWLTGYVDADGTGAGWSVNTAATTMGVQSYAYPSEFHIQRIPVSFDLATLPTGAVVSTGSVVLYATSKQNADNDGNDLIGLFAGALATNTAIVATDFDGCSDTAITNNYDITSVTTSSDLVFTLNSAGLALVTPGSFYVLCGREGHDFLNDTPTAGVNDIYFSTNEGSFPPYMEIYYTLPGPGGGSGGTLIVGEYVHFLLAECIAYSPIEDGTTICSHFTFDTPTSNYTCDETIPVDTKECSQWSYAIVSDGINGFMDILMLMVWRLLGGLVLVSTLGVVFWLTVRWVIRTMWPPERNHGFVSRSISE